MEHPPRQVPVAAHTCRDRGRGRVGGRMLACRHRGDYTRNNLAEWEWMQSHPPSSSEAFSKLSDGKKYMCVHVVCSACKLRCQQVRIPARI